MAPFTSPILVKSGGGGVRSIGGYRDHTTTRSDATLVVSCDKYQCERYCAVACLGLRFRGLAGWLGLYFLDLRFTNPPGQLAMVLYFIIASHSVGRHLTKALCSV